MIHGGNESFSVFIDKPIATIICDAELENVILWNTSKLHPFSSNPPSCGTLKLLKCCNALNSMCSERPFSHMLTSDEIIQFCLKHIAFLRVCLFQTSLNTHLNHFPCVRQLKKKSYIE